MVLTRLEVKRFKCLRDFAVEFAPGLNLVRGPNESGKSTLRAALTAALFANPTSASEAVDRWTSWGQAKRCELKLDYLDAAGNPCQLRKDFANREVFFTRGEEAFRTWKTIQQEVLKDIGLATEELFGLCASLDVRTLSQLGTSAASRKDIGKMLASLMTGAESGQDMLTAIRRLDDALRELGKGLVSASKTPGPLKSSRAEVERLLGERARLEKDLASRRDRQLEAERLQSAAAQAAVRLQDLDRLLTANRKLAEAAKRRDELAAQDGRFEQAAALRRQVASELEAVRAQVAANPAASLAAEDLARLREALDALRAEAPQPAPAPGSAHPLAWYLAAAAALGVSWLVGGLPWGAVLGVLAGGVLSFVGWRAAFRAREAAAARRTQIAAAEAKHREAESALGALLARAGGLDAETLLARWPEAQAQIARQRALEKQIGDAPPDDEAAWKALRRDLRLVEDTLADPDLLALRLPPVELAARERERQQLEAARAEQTGKLARLQGILDHDVSSPDRLAEIDEALAGAKERVAWLEERERVGQLALEYLNRARKDTLSPARQILETRGGELLATFSRGRYRQIAVDDETLDCKVFLPETHRWEDPSVLSQGAFDQFYLGLRLALSEVLAGGPVAAPLLLDEPLAAFDAERVALTLEWLRQAAGKRQILFFTCRSDYDRAAGKLIELQRPD